MQMSKEVSILKIDDILPNRFQPRIVFDENAINELTESIKEYGVIEPIIVRKVADKYEIIAGERRYKASVLAGKETIPAIITDLNDKDSAEIALIENVQRQNLTPIEEAVSYKKILDMGYMNQSELAEKLGKKQSTVANKLRLLNLTDTVQEALLQEKISERHARSLLRLPKDKQDEMLDRITRERMTVRKTDEEINKILTSSTSEEKKEEKEETNMNNNDFMNQFNIPNTPIMESPVKEQPVTPVEPAISEVPQVQPISPIEPVMPQVAPVTQEPVNPIFNASTPIQNIQSVSPIEPVINEVPQVQPISPIEPIGTASQTEVPTVQTINNEPATAENSDTPISGRFFNMFGNEENDQTEGEQKTLEPNPVPQIEDINGFNPINNLQPTSPEKILDNQVQNTSPIEPVINEVPQVQPVSPIEPVMPQVSPVTQEPVNPIFNSVSSVDTNSVSQPQVMEPIPMPTIPVAPEMQPTQQVDVNPIQTFQLNDNQEFTNSSVVELGTLQNRRMEEPTLQPLMDQPDNTPKIGMKEIINMIRNCASEIEKNGYTIDTDELDFDDSYQVIFKINKND